MSDLTRMTKIVARSAQRFGVAAAVYAGAESFDILTERWREDRKTGERHYDGMAWVKTPMRDVYVRPAAAARRIRSEMGRLWA